MNVKSAIIIIFCILCITPVIALNITPTRTGTTYITWDWDNGTNVSALYVDGHLMCGYESTLPSINVLGLAPGTCHNLSVFVDLPDNGENISCTAFGNISAGTGTTSGNDLLSTNNIIYGLLGALAGGAVLLGKFMQ